jgi:hypothetical protein
MSEPAKIDEAGTAMDFLALPPGLGKNQRASAPPGLPSSPPGLEQPDALDVAALLLPSEPLKVHIRGGAGTSLKCSIDLEDDDEAGSSTTPSTRSGHGSVSTLLELPSIPTSPCMPESPIFSTSPTHQNCKVDLGLHGGQGAPVYSTSPVHDRRGEALLAENWFGQAQAQEYYSEGWGSTSCMVMLGGMPMQYTEENLLEELHKTAFIPRRDFDYFAFDSQSGSCILNFVDATVMRSFIASFDGRDMRLAGHGFEFEVDMFLS